MRIIVAGGSGFLGGALVRAWRREGHEVKVLTRHPGSADDVPWAPESGNNGPWITVLERADAVVNLAGAGIADERWTAARQTAILRSRVTATRAIAEAIRGCAHPPRIFISASAVGFYGTTRVDEFLTEDAAPGADFLATVCQAWERETTAAAGIARIVLLRTGVVLARDGGALPKMALPFRFFVGGRLGSGRQYISWIHLQDWVEMVRWILRTDVSGPLNLTAPAPVTNAEFTRALGDAMHRPSLLPVPAVALRVLLGREFADALLLDGQRALPARAQRLGFQFKFAAIDSALHDIFRE
jgi:uncharacterized protein (TIGR01777 family)